MTRGPLARFLLLASIWGASFLFIKVALEGMTDLQVVLGRCLFGAVALAAIVVARRVPLPRSPTIWGHLLLLGLIANVVPFFCFAWAEDGRVSSGLAGIYNASTPLATLLIAISVLPEERATRPRLVGLVLGFLGVVVVIAPWRGLGAASFGGQLACLLAAACYGVAITYTRRFLSGSGHPPLALAAGQVACASVVMLALAPFVAADPVSLPWRVVASIVALGALGTGVAYLLFYALIGEVGATRASTVTYVVPLVAVTLGIVVLGESVTWNDFVGAAVVVLGISVAEQRLRLRPRSTAAL